MSLTLGSVVIDCADPVALMPFWQAALGYERRGTWDPFIWLVDPTGSGTRVGLQKVDAPTEGKNRIHFDLYADDLEAEVSRLVGLGATLSRVHDHDYATWRVLTDPAGNEFCVVAKR
jgi:predicted enzyme related to lactoylglutathione lyase